MPSLQGEHPRITARLRSAVSVLVLAASLTALALILQEQHVVRFVAVNEAEAEAADPDGSQLAQGETVSPAEDSRYRALSDSVARRYRVSQEMAYDLVHLAHTVGQQHGLDPLLIIAIIAIESRFNPIAESLNGAKGLMQIIPRYHTAKLAEYGGEKALFDPIVNVRIGSRILKDYLRLTGNIGRALQMYAGAPGDADDYTTKVMNEQQRLKQALPPNARRQPSASPSLAAH
jgi:soluble lytic murein transglycosylase-like protein